MRIGIDMGEPISDSNDLFGATVQMAARLCQRAAPNSILVSGAVREMAQGSCEMTALTPALLKGFAEPVSFYEVRWS